MKLFIIASVLLSFCSFSMAEMRLWTFTDGKTVEAEFQALVVGNVVLKGLNEKTVRIPLEKFSPEDLSYIDLQNPPQLDLDFSKKSEQRIFPEALIDTTPRAMYYDFSATIKQRSTRQYNAELIAELFVYADEIDGDNHILLDYQKVPFRLPDGSKSIVEIKGARVELTDFVIAGQRRGETYGGFILVVTDQRGEVVEYTTSSEDLYNQIENIRQVPVGKFFNEEGNRCFPTRPDKMY